MHVHRWPDDAGPVSPLYIANGVTGIRTMGVSRSDSQQFLKFRAELKAGNRLGPRMMVASRSFMNGNVPLQPDEARMGVREAVQDGADFIKVHDTLSNETYFAIADEAVKLGIPFVGHVPNVDLSVDACAKAGQKTIEHMAGVLRYLNWNDTPGWLESVSAARKEARFFLM